MTSHLFTGLLLLLLPLFSFRPGYKENIIPWSADRKLSWSDYKGRPDKEIEAAASTATFLGISYSVSREGFTYKIICHFSKDKSWVRHKTDLILAHEQGHFDIAEIFARKLNKRMQEYRFNAARFEKEAGQIYQDITREKEALQRQYDAETNHSINVTKQEEWLVKISGLLKELEAYASYP